MGKMAKPKWLETDLHHQKIDTFKDLVQSDLKSFFQSFNSNTELGK